MFVVIKYLYTNTKTETMIEEVLLLGALCILYRIYRSHLKRKTKEEPSHNGGLFFLVYPAV